MGFFSWKTQDTGISISNSASRRGTFPVTMSDDKGHKWTEPNYKGYGVFGGKDFFELVAEMNGFPANRKKGIDIAFGSEDYKSPNLNQSSTVPWKNEKPEDCEYQGFFYDDDDDGEDEDDYDEDLDESLNAPRKTGRLTEGMTKQDISDLGKKILDTSRKTTRLSTKEIDALLENYLTNSATTEESYVIAKRPMDVLDEIESHNMDRPIKQKK